MGTAGNANTNATTERSNPVMPNRLNTGEISTIPKQRDVASEAAVNNGYATSIQIDTQLEPGVSANASTMENRSVTGLPSSRLAQPTEARL